MRQWRGELPVTMLLTKQSGQWRSGPHLCQVSSCSVSLGFLTFTEGLSITTARL